MKSNVPKSRIWPRWLRHWLCGRKDHPGIAPFMRGGRNVVAICHRCDKSVAL